MDERITAPRWVMVVAGTLIVLTVSFSGWAALMIFSQGNAIVRLEASQQASQKLAENQPPATLYQQYVDSRLDALEQKFSTMESSLNSLNQKMDALLRRGEP